MWDCLVNFHLQTGIITLKNYCERKTTKQLQGDFRREHPHLKTLLVIFDTLDMIVIFHQIKKV